MAKMTYQEVKDWAGNLQDDGSPFCGWCFTRLVRTETDDGFVWYCPNEDCLNDEQYPSEPDF